MIQNIQYFHNITQLKPVSVSKANTRRCQFGVYSRRRQTDSMSRGEEADGGRAEKKVKTYIIWLPKQLAEVSQSLMNIPY